jgi:hypothetical protein
MSDNTFAWLIRAAPRKAGHFIFIMDKTITIKINTLRDIGKMVPKVGAKENKG